MEGSPLRVASFEALPQALEGLSSPQISPRLDFEDLGLPLVVFETPISNTGVHLTVTKPVAVLDHLTLTFPADRLDQLSRLFQPLYGQSHERPGLNHYQRGLEWESGTKVLWTEGREECCVVLPGAALGSITTVAAQRELVRGLDALGWKNCTRADAALDLPRDAQGLELMERALEALNARNVVGFRVACPYAPIDLSTGERKGFTLYFGSRQSGKYVRIYDKHLESRGRRSCIRIETEYKEGYALALWRKLCEEAQRFTGSDEGFARVIGQAAVASISFADRDGSHGHKDRMKVYEWWSRVVDLVGRLELVVARSRSTLQGSLEWFSTMARTVARFAITWEKQTGECADNAIHTLTQAMLDHGRDRGAPASVLPIDLLGVTRRLLDFRDRCTPIQA